MLVEFVGSDETGTAVKKSKPCALALPEGASELAESTQALVRRLKLLEWAD